MSSIINGFEYDIFISYRQNDNRSGWVTEFVHHLQEELSATIKEPLSIYFDQNPHDGLLETHNVDKSLEGKLKCLIFIPILSQTYCDPKSFAWQHEFCAFNRMAKEDQFGRDVKLGNGNVASRILPVNIHALDAEDKATIEKELGAALRAIEFIYKEPGVNRPLTSSDPRSLNQLKLDYRNQVNKVALAIKEIKTGATRSPRQPEKPASTELTKPKRSIHAYLWIAAICVLSMAGLGFWFLSGEDQSTGNHTALLDRAEQYLEEGRRFNDMRYKEQAFQAIQKVLSRDSSNERALYLLITLGPKADTTEYFIRKLNKISPDGTYSLLAQAGRLIERDKKWEEARKVLNKVLERNPKNRDGLNMMSFLCLATQDYLNCYQYAKQLETVDPKEAHDILTSLYTELGDFKEAYRQLQLKQDLQDFACSDVEGFQRILLCEGNFEKLERLTDSLCNFSNCAECPSWQLRAKTHLKKFKEAAKWVQPSLLKAPKITWRYPAFVLLKNGKADSARLIAQQELDYDKNRLADSSYKQSLPLYSMASIHAMFGEKDKAINYLRQYASRGFEIGSEWYITHDPLFDELKKDNEFFAEFLQLFQKEQIHKSALREELRKLENGTN